MAHREAFSFLHTQPAALERARELGNGPETKATAVSNGALKMRGLQTVFTVTTKRSVPAVLRQLHGESQRKPLARRKRNAKGSTQRCRPPKLMSQAQDPVSSPAGRIRKRKLTSLFSVLTCTDSSVRRLSAWLPTRIMPDAACPYPAEALQPPGTTQTVPQVQRKRKSQALAVANGMAQ